MGWDLVWSDWCPSKRSRRHRTRTHQGPSEKVVVAAAEGPAGGPFSPHLDIPLSVSRIERDECLPLGRPGHRAGSGRRRRPTVGWPFVLLLDTPAPLVLLGRQLPPATWTQGLPPLNRAECGMWFRPCSMGRGGQCCPEMGRACSSNPGAGSRQGASKRQAGAREAQRRSRT